MTVPIVPLLFRRLLRVTAIALAASGVLAAGAVASFRIAAASREHHNVEELAPPTGRHVPTSLGAVFVQEGGPPNGKPVVLVHGTAAWSGFWREILDELGDKGFRTIAVDLPPFGFSARPDAATYTAAEQARRLSEVLDGLAIREAAFVGHSFGSRAVVETAMRFPERVSALVLVSAALDPDSDDAPASSTTVRWALDTPFIRELAVAATVTNPVATGPLLRGMLARRDAATPQVLRVLQHPLTRQGTTAAVGQWLPAFILPDRSALSGTVAPYGRLAMPVALIWGGADEVTPLSRADRLRRLIPQATLDILPDVGHIPHIEDPARFKPALAGQLQRVLNDRSKSSFTAQR